MNESPQIMEEHPPPYSNFAHFYDAIYEAGYGSVYEGLTRKTLAAIRKCCNPPARMVDFGAGTGRLSIPLAEAGYAVTAVEPCAEMLEVLIGKSGESPITTHLSTLEQFNSTETFDVAIAVFTVLIHLTDEETLRAGVRNLVGSVKPGGSVFIDIPQRRAFSDRPTASSNRFQRKVVIRAINDDVYDYRDTGHILIGDDRKEWAENFQIRYWDPEFVKELLRENNIDRIIPIAGFETTGSEYYHCQKKA